MQRWLAAVSEADGVWVLDTGSTDDTAALLAAGGAQVTTEIITPWRFDTARNRALSLLPEDADVCVSVDLDEVLRPGWRQTLERAWRPGMKQAAYRYTWSFEADGSEGCVFYREHIHARRGFRWKYPVHEVLEYTGAESGAPVFLPGIQLDHHPDETKSRGTYLPLLELAVREDPQNDRNAHYLGREYMYHGRYREAIEELQRHLALPGAVWREERCASQRFLARCHTALGEEDEAFSWLLRAVGEAPWLREPWTELAAWGWRRGDWETTAYAAQRAVEIRARGDRYISEAAAWGPLPWDLGALGCYYTQRYARAAEMAAEALRLAPEDARLRENLRQIKEKLP